MPAPSEGVEACRVSRSLRHRYLDWFDRPAKRVGADELRAPALVVAPHPDDETLGCGGTIVAKRAAGARVRIVVLTDGSASHRALMPEESLAKLRHAELLEACRRLGVDAGEVSWLGLPDGSLAASREAALAGLAPLLREDAVQLFLPSPREPHVDHVAAATLSLEALKRVGRPADVFEYGVWFWHHWPLIDLPRGRRAPRAALSGLRALRHAVGEFDTAVDVAAHAEMKRHALDAYASQMTRLVDDPRWSTLPEVAGGRFLELLLRPVERFHRHRFQP